MTKIKGTKCDICGDVIGKYSKRGKVVLKAKGKHITRFFSLLSQGSVTLSERIDLCGECWDKVRQIAKNERNETRP